MAKKGKAKISKIKRNNQTTNKMKKQGKLKLQRHRTKIQKQKQPTQTQPEYSSESESSSNEWADMLDEEEQAYITKRLAKQPQLLSNIPQEDSDKKKNLKRKRGKEKVPKLLNQNDESQNNSDSDNSENSDVEEKYEKDMAEKPAKKFRPLLPIKTKEGIIERMEECKDSESEKEDESIESEEEKDEMSDDGSDSGIESNDVGESPETEMVTTVQLLAARRDRLEHEKLRIGALCSSLLESPEKKIKNLFPILYLMEEQLKDGTPNLLSVRKLATLSVAEVFRDLLPDYRVRHQDYSDVKLKKDTLAMYKYEKELVEFYKRYLQRLEKAANALRRKRGDQRKLEEGVQGLALVSLRCMCSMLEARPHFNFATNIAQSVVPFLDSRLPAARETVGNCCSNIFNEDQKGEITLTIVRLINQLVKRRGERLHPSALDCLLSLRIRDVELDAEADAKHKKKQDEKHKKRIVNLSKKEKKRAKKLKEVEQELLETQAQENEAARKKQLTEVTKTVFHIYFRVLKTAPHSGLLTAALNGLAKFTHVINLEYYTDLVSILTALMRDEALTARARLQCVRTALAVLAGAGDALNVDPAHFHEQLYAAALRAHAGSAEEEARLVLEGVWQVCARARLVSAGVLQAFAKRLGGLAARLPHHAALAALALLHHLTQQSKPVSSLLETDEPAGSGRYAPLSPSPQHCCAHAATLFELPALRRSYHPTVRAAAAGLLQGTWPPELNKLSPLEIYKLYDGSSMAFKPAIPPPKVNETGKIRTAVSWVQADFRDLCAAAEESVGMELKDNVIR